MSGGVTKLKVVGSQEMFGAGSETEALFASIPSEVWTWRKKASTLSKLCSFAPISGKLAAISVRGAAISAMTSATRSAVARTISAAARMRGIFRASSALTIGDSIIPTTKPVTIGIRRSRIDEQRGADGENRKNPQRRGGDQPMLIDRRGVFFLFGCNRPLTQTDLPLCLPPAMKTFKGKIRSRLGTSDRRGGARRRRRRKAVGRLENAVFPSDSRPDFSIEKSDKKPPVKICF